MDYDEPLPNLRSKASYRGGRKKTVSASVSHSIAPETARNVLRANRFATTLGIPINAHLTIDFPADIPDEQTPRLVSSMLRNWRQWLRRKGLRGDRSTYIWARERSVGKPCHVHVLLHVPAEVRTMVNSKRFAEFLPRTALIDPAKIPQRPQPYSGVPVLLVLKDDAAENWARYIIKGIAQGYADQFEVKAKRQGRLAGKRVGIAENLMTTEVQQFTFNRKHFGFDFAIERWRERATSAKRGV